ncbi:hypothetical protein R6Q59_029785 [Mikania micrantha]
MSKKTTEDVSQPTNKTPGARSQTSLSTRTSKSDQSPRGRGSSSVSSSVPASGSSSGNSYNKDSWKSSVSSRSSLSSLRDFLPENPHVYHFKEIFTATKGFLSPKYSSSSSAWRCVIRGDDVIVFQRKCKRPIDETELRERLLVICKSHHSSLIKLRGASISGSYIYLVYDFVTGVSLADCLKNPRNPNFTILSDWMPRIEIAADLAHGLDYIHNSTGLQKKFIHNHIKSSSVIVMQSSSSMNAVICHFGTAELCNETDSSEPDQIKLNSNVTKFEGTRGYMSPEFQSTGVATQKSDVYAFGVVVLEILSGEEPLQYRQENGSYVRISLIETARAAVESGGVRRWIDRRLKDSFPEEVALKVAQLGLVCVEEDPEKRPDARWVAGRISKLYLESQSWYKKMGQLPADFTVSMAPR